VVYTFQTIFFLNQWFISTKGTIRNLIKDVQASGLFGRQYKILISLRHNLFQRWSSPKQYLCWALKQFDHMLARVRWRGKAHGDDNQLFSRTNELLHGTPAISATPSTVRMQGEIKTCSKDDSVQSNKLPKYLKYIDRMLPHHDWRRYSMVFTYQWIPGHVGQFLLRLHVGYYLNLFQSWSIINQCVSRALEHFDWMLACV
jgi:hypothetical protein